MIKIKSALALLLMAPLLGIAACGGDEGDDYGSGPQPITVKTHLAFPPGDVGGPKGEVLDGSTIGDSPFCVGGTFHDGSETGPIGSVTRSFHCSDGTLQISFSMSDESRSPTGNWTVDIGYGDLTGFSGGGDMKAVFEPKAREGHETFTGTVTP